MDSSKKTTFILLAFFVTATLSLRLYLIWQHGSYLPFWDQWDAEADLLYKPLLLGNYTWDHLIAPHVDHRIIATRLIDMVLFWFVGWNPLVQMTFNITFHIFAMTLLLFFVIRHQGITFQIMTIAFALLLFMIPFGSENILWGFQSQIYLSILFAVAALWVGTGNPPLSRHWFTGLLLGFCAFYSFASGIFVFFALTCVIALQSLIAHKITIRDVIAATITIALFVLLYRSMPHVVQNDILKAPTIGAWFQALCKILVWPVSEKSHTLGILIYLPAAVFTIMLLWRKIAADRLNLFLVALLCWCLGIAASIAYGRYQEPLASRYMDFWLTGILANFAMLMLMVFNSPWRGRMMRSCATIWAVVMVYATIYAAGHSVLDRLKGQIALTRLGEQNVIHYLCTGDSGALQKHIPYPDPQRLQSFLDDKTIVRVLPEGFMRMVNCQQPATSITPPLPSQ